MVTKMFTTVLLSLLSHANSSCDPVCASCTGSREWNCLSCPLGRYLQPNNSGLCFNYCPTGYTADISQVCTGGAQEVIVDYILDQIGPIVKDKYRGWAAQNGATATYPPPSYEATDPIPARKRGYHFNGNQYITLPPYSGSLDPTPLPGTDVSVLAWVKPESRQSFTILGLSMPPLASSADDALVLKLAPDGTVLLVTQMMTFHSISSVNLSQWTLIIVTLSCVKSNSQDKIYTAGKFYINGAFDSSSMEEGYVFTDKAGFGSIGQDYDISATLSLVTSEFFVGFIYQVKLFNYALVGADIVNEAGDTILANPLTLNSCLYNEYFDNSGSCISCAPCPESCVRPTDCYLCADVLCAVCSTFDAGSCTTCKPHASMNIALCQCDSGYFLDSSTNSCAACSTDCLSCEGPNSTECASCKAHAQLVSAKPASCICSSGYSGSPSNCQACDVTCPTCAAAGSNQCTACWPHATLTPAGVGTCLCSSGYFGSAQSCQVCSTDCLTCAGGGTAQCTACKGNAALDTPGQGSCKCVTGYYGAPASCTPCDSTCLTCVGAGFNECSACKTNAALDTPGKGTCTCIAGYYGKADSCASCDLTCLTCVAAGSNNCSACKSHATLSAPGVGTCTCDMGYYGSPDSCMLCDTTCAGCSGPGSQQCTGCFANAQLGGPGSSCVCQGAFYPAPDSSTCANCHSTCAACTGGADTTCTSCYANAHTDSSSRCVCDSAYFPNPTSRTCSACTPTCAECKSVSVCTACFTHASGSPTFSCECDPGFAPTPTSRNCTPCAMTCKTCAASADNQCLSCFPHAALAISPIGPCECIPGWYLNAAICDPCDKTCRTCVGPRSSDCSDCKQQAVLQTLPTGSCSCKEGYYRDAFGDCEPCHYSCFSCSAAEDNACTSCFPHSLLSAGYCRCEIGFWTMPISATCIPCHASCASCVLGTQSDCSSCVQGYQLKHSPVGECICPASFFLDSGQCMPCTQGCESCQSQSECLQCAEGWSLVSGKCSQGCKVYDNCQRDNDPTKCFSAQFTETQQGFSILFSANLSAPLSEEQVLLSLTPPDELIPAESWDLLTLSPNFHYALVLHEEVRRNTTAMLAFASNLVGDGCLGLSTLQLQVPLNSTAGPLVSTLISSAQTPVATVATTLAIAAILSGSSGLFWVFFHNIQLISYIPLSLIPLPDNLRNILISSNPFDLLPNPFNYVRSSSTLDMPEHIQNEGISTFSYLLNIGGAVTSLLFCLFLSLLYLVLQCMPVRVIRKWAENKAKMKFASDWPRLWVETYLTVSFGVCLQMYEVAIYRPETYSSFERACMGAALPCALLVCSALFFTHPRALSCSKILLHEEFAKKSSAWFWPLFCGRRLLFAGVQVFLPHFPHLQGVLNIAHCCWVSSKQFSLYAVAFVRYRQRVLQLVNTLAEVGVTLVFVLCEAFYLDLSQSQRSILELNIYSLIAVISAVHVVGACVLIGTQLSAILRNFTADKKTAQRKKELTCAA